MVLFRQYQLSTTMTAPFIPPYPKRHSSDLSAVATLFSARRDLLSFWSEDSFRYKFMARKIFNRHIFIVNKPEFVKYVFLTQKDNYESKSPQMRKALEPLLGDGLFISDGEIWKNRRLLQNGLFDQNHIIAYSQVMIDTSLEMVERWAALPEGASIGVLSAMGELTSEIIARALFGTRLNESAKAVIDAFADYQRAIEQIHMSNFLGLPDWWPMLHMGKAKPAAKRIHQIIDTIIAKADQSQYEHTLLSELLAANQASKGQAISFEGIRNELIVLFMAGHETTANALSWVWYCLSQAPEVEAKLHEELERVLAGRLPTYEDVVNLPYTRSVFEETMRLYPPVPILSRQAKHDDVMLDKKRTKIPAGSMMLVVPWLLHRHRDYWYQPDAFIPERFMDANKRPDKFLYLPFSVGPRVCIGKMFGMVEAVLAIAILAQRFRLSLPPATVVTHECRLTLRPKGELKMRLERR